MPASPMSATAAFVHAPSTGGTVRLDTLTSGYWQGVYLDAKRVITPELARNP